MEVYMALHFDKYAQEGNIFVKSVANKLGHPDEVSRTGIIIRSVMHTLRDRLTVSESLNLIAQLPMFLKAVYVENWKYREQPLRYDTLEEFKAEVKKRQEQYGEHEFDWKKSTDEIIAIVLQQMGIYISRGEAEDIMAQLPKELEELLRENVYA